MIRKIFPILACLFLAASTAHAQSNYAVVGGSILDPQQRPIVGAQVHILSRKTGATRTAWRFRAERYAFFCSGLRASAVWDLHLRA